ncbi:MAG: cell division protein FtsQ/DivIB [Rubrivivax sp.]|nr:cell division protein FtsQ/DivIB [Rubrivivax sp.]
MARTLTRSRTAAAPAAAVLPGDVRLMNAVASTVFVGVGLGLLAAGVLWLTRSPLFPIRAIELGGDLARNSVPTIRANATPLLAGNFYGIDLQQGRAAFEAVPWVRRAVVRRVWPDRLAVDLEEHRPAALWEGAAGAVDDAEGSTAGLLGDRLVNTYGEVFAANLGEVEDEALPRLAGPEGSAAQMLALLQRLRPLFAGLDLAVDRVRLSGRGSWRVELDSGAVVELGRGSEDELVARCERFVRTLDQVTARWNAPLQYADLRHADGYAVRLRGVSTGAAAGTNTNAPTRGRANPAARAN